MPEAISLLISYLSTMVRVPFHLNAYVLDLYYTIHYPRQVGSLAHLRLTTKALSHRRLVWPRRKLDFHFQSAHDTERIGSLVLRKTVLYRSPEDMEANRVSPLETQK